MGRCSDGECSVRNSCKTSAKAGLNTAVLWKNLSLDLFYWLGVCPGRKKSDGRKQGTQIKLLQLFCCLQLFVRGSLVVHVLETHCVSLLLDA